MLLAISSKPLPVPSQVGNVPRGFDAWFAKACARDVRDRFASAKDAAAELATLCNESRGEAERPSLPKLPKLAPLPSLPKLIEEDEDEDEAPTEIWREDSIESLVGLAQPVPRLLTPLPMLPPLQPAPSPAARQLRPEAHTDSKAPFSKTTAESSKPLSKRKAQRAVVGLCALGLAGFAGLVYGERAALQRMAAPSASIARGAQPEMTPTPTPSPAPIAEASAPAPELVPTIDLKQLPLAKAPPIRAAKPQPRKPKAAPASPDRNEDELANPYR